MRYLALLVVLAGCAPGGDDDGCAQPRGKYNVSWDFKSGTCEPVDIATRVVDYDIPSQPSQHCTDSVMQIGDPEECKFISETTCTLALTSFTSTIKTRTITTWSKDASSASAERTQTVYRDGAFQCSATYIGLLVKL